MYHAFGDIWPLEIRAVESDYLIFTASHTSAHARAHTHTHTHTHTHIHTHERDRAVLPKSGPNTSLNYK